MRNHLFKICDSVKYNFITCRDKFGALVLILVIILSCSSLRGQSLFGLHFYTPAQEQLYKAQINSNSLCNSNFCSPEYIATILSIYYQGITMSPEGDLYTMSGNVFFNLDTLTGFAQPIYAFPVSLGHFGLIATGGEIFYTIVSDG